MNYNDRENLHHRLQREENTQVIKRDGVEVHRCSGRKVMNWFHNNRPHSMDWALRYEGYTVEEERE